MRGSRDIFSGKSIYNRETISRQEHRISEYRIKIESNDSIGFRIYGSKSGDLVRSPVSNALILFL